MQSEDLNSKINLTLDDVLRDKQNQLNSLTLQNAQLSEQVEEGKAAMEERDKLKTELESTKEELKVTRGDYITAKKEKEKMQHIIDRQTEQMSEQKAELERTSQLLSEKSAPHDKQSESGSQHHNAQQKSIDQRKSNHSLSSAQGAKPASSGLHAVKTVAFGKEVEVQTDMLMRDIGRQQ
jgi:uncharacterized protein (DUF3084 family)